MSRFIDFTLPSTVPGRTLHGFRCVPEGQVRAVLQLSHGMVEFIDLSLIHISEPTRLGIPSRMPSSA